MHNYTSEEKITILIEGSIRGVKNVIKEKNIPRQTYYTWKSKYQKEFKEKLKQNKSITFAEIKNEIDFLKQRIKALEIIFDSLNTKS